MKKLLICSALILTFAVGSAQAWDYCFYDENYTVTELYFSIYGAGYLHGEANFGGFFGAITGRLSNGMAYFSIDYLGDSGLRFYVIDLQTRAGETWGVFSDSGEFYDTPHSAQLQPCGPGMIDLGEAESGAAVDYLTNEK